MRKKTFTKLILNMNLRMFFFGFKWARRSKFFIKCKRKCPYLHIV